MQKYKNKLEIVKLKKRKKNLTKYSFQKISCAKNLIKTMFHCQI